MDLRTELVGIGKVCAQVYTHVCVAHGDCAGLLRMDLGNEISLMLSWNHLYTEIVVSHGLLGGVMAIVN